MTPINQNALQIVPTLNQLLPDEGPCSIPVSIDFTKDTVFRLDLQEFQAAQKRFSILQTVYIDLKSVTADLRIDINNSRQVIIAKGGTQGYYTVLVPNPVKLLFTSTAGAGLQIVILINVPIPSAVWPPSAGTTLISGSASLDFGNILDGDTADLTFPLVGSLIGDGVIPGWPSAMPAGFTGIMWVSAIGTITVRVLNMSGGNVDPAALTFAALIIR